jgi:hypothetical protein
MLEAYAALSLESIKNEVEVKTGFLYVEEEVLESYFGAVHQIRALVSVLFSMK